MTASSKIFRSAFVVMCVLLLVKPVNLAKEILVAAYFGTSAQMDLFFASLVVPTMVVGALGGLFQATVVPVFQEFTDDHAGRNAWFSSLVTIFGAGLIAGALLLFIGTTLLVPLWAPAYIASRSRAFILLSAFACPAVFFFGMATLMRSYLEAVFDFKTPAVLQVSIAVVVIGFVALAGRAGVTVLAAGSCAGTVVYFLLMWRAVSRAGFRYGRTCDFGDGRVRKVCFLMLPLIVGTAFTHLNVAVDIIMASFLKEGSISALSYAEKLMFAVRSFFVFSLSTVALSYFSHDVARGSIDSLDQSIGHAVRFSAVFLVPLSLFCMIMAVPLVAVLFQRGEFTQVSTLMTGRAFACFAAGLFPVALVFIIPRVFYALQENSVVLAVSVAGSALNVLLNYIFMRFLGAAGIALSTSTVYLLSAGLLLYLLKRRLPALDVLIYAKRVIPVVISSLVAAAAMMTFYTMRLFALPVFNLASATAIFGGVYAGMLFFLSKEDIALLAGSVRSMVAREKAENGNRNT